MTESFQFIGAFSSFWWILVAAISSTIIWVGIGDLKETKEHKYPVIINTIQTLLLFGICIALLLGSLMSEAIIIAFVFLSFGVLIGGLICYCLSVIGTKEDIGDLAFFLSFTVPLTLIQLMNVAGDMEYLFR